MKQVAGIWLPDAEVELIPFLTDPKTQRRGKGTYQIHKLEAALRHCKAFRCALDIGSHVGLWTMHLIRRFDDVHCFEMSEEHRECWRANIEPGPQDGVAHLWPFGLGVDNTVCTMVEEAMPQGGIASGGNRVGDFGGISGRGDHLISDRPGVAHLRRLDDVAGAGFWTAIDFIKMDVEGFEYFVLRGGEKTIREHRPVMIVEQKPGRAEKYSLNQYDAKVLLEAWGAREVERISGDHIFTW